MAKSCQAVQFSAKGMEQVLDELRQIKSNIQDLNAAQTQTNFILSQQQSTLEAIRKSSEQQVEIERFKLKHHAVHDTSGYMVEEFCFGLDGGGGNGLEDEAFSGAKEKNEESPEVRENGKGFGCGETGERAEVDQKTGANE